MVEVSIKVQDDEKTFVQKHLYHENDTQGALVLSHDDPELQSMVQEAINQFKGEPTDVTVRCKYVW